MDVIILLVNIQKHEFYVIFGNTEEKYFSQVFSFEMKLEIEGFEVSDTRNIFIE